MASPARKIAAPPRRAPRGDLPPPRRPGRHRPRLRRLHRLPPRNLRAPSRMPLHPPPVLGLLDPDLPGAFHPADPPHRYAPAARALAHAADFSFAFLPAPNCWRVCDALDARVLLRRRASDAAAFADLVVCDPLHRRYVQLPPIPEDLVVSTGARRRSNFDTFFDPASKEKEKQGEEDDLSFGVICAVQLKRKLVTFHFNSVTGEWGALMFNRVRPLITPDMATYSGMCTRHYAHGCFYWTICDTDGDGSGMFMQDTREMRLCKVEFPAVTYHQQKAIVEVGEGRLGLLALHDGLFHLYCKTLRDNCIGTEEWQHDRTIPLPKLDSTLYCGSLEQIKDMYF